MKKYLLVSLVFSFVLFGCKRNDISEIDINKITDLATLQNTITSVSEEMNEGTITMDQAQSLVDQLQQKYVDLTDNTQQSIETTFNQIQKTFENKSIALYTLPLRARKLGMTAPRGMELDKALSKQISVNASGYDSILLTYQGNYTIALQQAKAIAQRAHLPLSKSFEQAQTLAKVGNIDYISGLDIGSLTKGVVYTNHELTDTNIDYMLSVSVDQNGNLTLEATKYK